jgi:FKBP-type peptidyl-prolyl cis-trans isomerase
MKNFAISLALILGLISCEPKAGSDAPVQLKTFEDSISFSVGGNVYRNLYRDTTLKSTILLEQVIAGMRKMDQGIDNFDIPDSTAMQLQQRLQQIMMQKQMEAQQAASAPNKKKGAEFLAKNKEKEGVTETASGLQYEVIKEGSGAKPKASDKVKVHYHGTLIDGTVFDSSVEKGEPIDFKLNQVIPGWTEGVQLMSVGSKYKFYIPSDLAYGDRDSGKIPGGSTLIFEVELLDIVQ